MATAGYISTLCVWFKAHCLWHIVQPCHPIPQASAGPGTAFGGRAPVGGPGAGRYPGRPPGLPLGSLPTSEAPPASAC